MDMSPLPQPHAYTCSHCGAGWDTAQSHCPNCGQTYRLAAAAPLPVNGCLAGCLGFFALGLGGFGGCLMVVFSGTSDEGFGDFAFFVGLTAFLFAAFIFYRVTLMFRKG